MKISEVINSGVVGVAEGFSHDVDHMPGKTTKHSSTNCTTCHGRKSMYKLGGKLFADKKAGSTKVKCPTCKGTGDKQGVAEDALPEHIVKVPGGYELRSKKGNKNLGKYPTKAGAEKRERQVQYFKHAK